MVPTLGQRVGVGLDDAPFGHVEEVEISPGELAQQHFAVAAALSPRLPPPEHVQPGQMKYGPCPLVWTPNQPWPGM